MFVRRNRRTVFPELAEGAGVVVATPAGEAGAKLAEEFGADERLKLCKNAKRAV
jgi:hypothetical protein